MKKKIPILSFFTGAGFLDMGFEKAGFNIIWTNEYDPIFIKFYEHGYNSWRRSEGKRKPVLITNSNSVEFLTAKEIRKEVFGQNFPEIWGIIGGPPCPDFSSGGKNNGVLGPNGQLSKKFINLIIELKPTFFLIENVSGLYRIKKHRKFVGQMRSLLAANNYITDIQILNSLHFGLAQDRPRTFIIGIKENCLVKILNNKDLPIDRNWFPFPEGNKKSLKGVKWPTTNNFGDNISLPANIPIGLTVYPLLASDPSPEELPNGKEYFKPYSYKFYSRKEGDTSSKSFKRLHRFRFSPTACYGNNEVHLHPWKPRRLSVREVLRIQGIPDSYLIPEGGPLSKKFKFIGNGVPFPLSLAIAKALKKFLNI